jgi:lipopolysaccharide transport system ATP-binding protein
VKPILEIKNISKKYNLFHEKVPYLSLRDSLSNVFNAKNKSSTEEFYALNDVSFTVNAGESIGIIGKNGAGKSTLLKILSKITPPTSGSIISRGRIASLLEVGTGFHPELSGRENVFMNGSILGMRQHEIKKNFDAIVDFAGVEKFIDTPLKHYSSGMQLRLAFAVAAFLENEILIIDEVLAVGDAEFQKKCMGKMGEVSKDGRTVLFVSHNLGVLQSLCKSALLLENGLLKAFDKTNNIIANYTKNNTIDVDNYTNLESVKCKVMNAFCSDVQGDLKQEFLLNEDVFITINWIKNIDIDVCVNIEVINFKGDRLFYSLSDKSTEGLNGKISSKVMIPKNLLNIGSYFIHIGLDSHSPQNNYDSKLNYLNFSSIDNEEILKTIKGSFVGIDTSNHILQPLLSWQNNLVI